MSQAYPARRASGRHALGYIADGQAQRLIKWAHGLGIPLHQVFVDGNDVHRDIGQSGSRGRQSRRQGFAFAGFHFRQLPVQHHPAAHQLGIIMPQVNRAPGQLPDQGKGPDAQRIAQSLTAEPAAQFNIAAYRAARYQAQPMRLPGDQSQC